ncbi:hypothetical protein VPHK45_0020 [Vibrio phage K45]
MYLCTYVSIIGTQSGREPRWFSSQSKFLVLANHFGLRPNSLLL